MKVVTKLRAAFAVYITLLGILLTYHVTTIRRAVATGHELTALSARVRATSNEQVTRVAQLGENAAKYTVTRDKGYLEKLTQLTNEYDAELNHLQSLSLSDSERREMTTLATQWLALGNPVDRITRSVQLGSAVAAQDSLTALQNALDALQLQTQRVGDASQEVMQTRLEQTASAAAIAENISWIAAIGILLLTILLSALLARSISEPLQRLTEGTRKVAQGQFDYRLDSTRDDEFAEVAKAFNSMTQRLGALDRMKHDFVTGVSHDLKTPLTSMQETINVLLDGVAGPLTEKQRTLLELNQQSSTRLSDMLAKLLNLSRLEAGLEPDLQVTDAAQLLRRAVDQVESAREERGLKIDLVLPEYRVLLECDYDRTLQVLDNLLENAIKFSPPGGEVRLEMSSVTSRPPEVPATIWSTVRTPRAAAGILWTTVTDDGPGVPDAEKPRIFDRFYQTPAGRSVPERGVGLGLAICREIVRSHGGAIWLADNPAGRGSVMNVLLPGSFRASADIAMNSTTPPVLSRKES